MQNKIGKRKPTKHTSRHRFQPRRDTRRMRGGGFVRYEFPNGDTYEGDWVSGGKHGRGKYRYENGNIYDGEWVNNKMHGQGKLNDGRGVYEGEFRENNMNGQGKLIYINGNIYDGEWVNDDMHGRGKMTVGSNGSSYDGEWKHNLKHGQGKYTFADGGVYEGEWVAGKQNGHGKRTSATGGSYEGDWVAGEQTGHGKMTGATGGSYEGEWADGKKHGRGTIRYTNGDTYKGDWVDGKKHGHGKMTFASGKIFDGEWVNDSFISRLESDIFYGVESDIFDESDILRDKLLKDWADMRKVTINKLAESNMAPNMLHRERGWAAFEVKNLINDLKKNQKHVIIDNMFIDEIVKIKNNMSDTSRINRAENLINARIRQLNGEKVEFGGLEDLLGHVLQSDINSIYIKANDMMEHTGGKKRTKSRKLKKPKRTNKKRKYNRKLRTRSKLY